jgi:hypothetical protein
MRSDAAGYPACDRISGCVPCYVEVLAVVKALEVDRWTAKQILMGMGVGCEASAAGARSNGAGAMER